MIAARAARRSLIGWLLLNRIEVTDRHPGLMFAGLAATILLAGLPEGVMP
jgi:hypothetical protein